MALDEVAELDFARGLTRRSFLAAAVATGAFLVGCSGEEAEPVAANVPMQAEQPLEQRVEVGTPLQFGVLEQIWQHQMPESIDYLTHANSGIAVSNDKNIYVIDPASGKMIKIDANIPKSARKVKPLIVDQRLLFVPENCGYLYIFDIKSGNLIFKSSNDVSFYDRTLVLNNEDSFYVCGVDVEGKNALYSFSVQDGKQLLRRPLEGIIPSSPEQMCPHNKNLVLSSGRAFYCIDPKTKALSWKWVPKGGSEEDSSGVIVYDMMKDGNTLYFTSRAILRGGLAHYDQGIFKARDEMNAFSLSTQKLQWAFEDPAYPRRYTIHKFVGGDTPYITYGKNVLNGVTGEPTGLPGGKFPLSSVAFFDNVAYIVDNGEVLALDPNNGSILKKYQAQQPITGNVFGADQSRIYVRKGNTIQAFGSK